MPNKRITFLELKALIEKAAKKSHEYERAFFARRNNSIQDMEMYAVVFGEERALNDVLDAINGDRINLNIRSE